MTTEKENYDYTLFNDPYIEHYLFFTMLKKNMYLQPNFNKLNDQYKDFGV